MFDVFMYAVNAIFPIILLIVLGYVLKRIGFLKGDWLKKANTFVFKVCLPCLLFINVYSIESFSSINWSVVLYSEIGIVAFFLIGMLFTKFFVKDPKKKGVILQCVFRSNFAIIGIPLAESLGGAAGVEVAAILSAFSIPTFNILAVIALSIYIKPEPKLDENGNVIPSKNSIKNVLINICKNPLILGVVTGLVFLGIRALIPTQELVTETIINHEIVTSTKSVLAFSLKGNLSFLYTAINNIGKIGSPFALIILGGLFDFSAVKGMLKEIVYGVSFRLVIVPVVMIVLGIVLTNCGVVKFDKTIYPALIALFGSPVAVSSAIMAEAMDNDGELAGQLVVWTSLLSIITIFVMVFVLRSMSLL